MNFRKLCRKTVSIILAVTACAGLTTQVFAQNTYNDFEYITSHVSLKVPQALGITRPSGNDSTTGSTYFITGNSQPDKKLYMTNLQTGKRVEITTRGSRGSFGVLVSLEKGTNQFEFTQEGLDYDVIANIFCGAGVAATTKVISSMAPSFDCATKSGETITLNCVAPSGASVVATVGGRQVVLKQAAATAKAGVPAVFTGKTTAGEVQGTRNLGPVTYTLNGQTAYRSAGSVYITGSASTLVVQVKNNAASVYKDEQQSAFIETAKLDAVDSVAEIGSSMYRLSSGGWIPKDSVQPLTQSVSIQNKISQISRGSDETNRKTGEYYILHGTSNPMFRAVQSSDKLSIKLFHTTGVGDVSGWTSGSQLFSGVSATEKDGATTLIFPLSGKRSLWGYDISYDNGDTIIYAKYKPALQSGNQPLKGITIAVDAGHGGSDPGAIGIPGTAGAMEKDITLDTAIAVQKRLESLGATVLMMRTNDADVTMNARMTATRKASADLFISLHCNSIGYATDGNKISGTEVYYFEGIAKQLATSLAANVSGYNGRTNRGAKLSNYRVTLNSFAPSVLVEIGFLTNPAEYDTMTTRRGIFNTANAVGDSVLAALK